MFHEMKIAGHTRKLPLCKVTDDLYIAGFIMFNDPELTVSCAEEILARVPDFDIILTAESKGIPLAYEVARQSGYKGYIVARKERKLYMQNVVYTDVDSITTDHLQQLCLSEVDVEALKGKRILIIDDVISTGESLASLEKLVERIEGNVVARAFVLAEGDAIGRDDIIYLEELPVFNPDGSIKG